jgi:hypothetical protein
MPRFILRELSGHRPVGHGTTGWRWSRFRAAGCARRVPLLYTNGLERTQRAQTTPCCSSSVENILFPAERHSGRRQRTILLYRNRVYPSGRSACRNSNGMVFGFRPETRSPSPEFLIFPGATPHKNRELGSISMVVVHHVIVLATPTRVSPSSPTEQKQNQENDQYS